MITQTCSIHPYIRYYLTNGKGSCPRCAYVKNLKDQRSTRDKAIGAIQDIVSIYKIS